MKQKELQDLPLNSIIQHSKKSTLIVIDVETSGFSCEYNHILECAGLILSNLEIVDRFNFFVKPLNGYSVNESALKVQKRSLQEVMKYPKSTAGMKLFEDKILEYSKDTDLIFVGHNVNFDIRFMNAFCNIHNKTDVMKNFKYSICTQRLIKKLVDNNKIVPPSKVSLGFLCEHFNIKNECEHTAMSDAKATYDLFLTLLSHI